MKLGTRSIVLIVLGIFLLVALFNGCSSYNKMVVQDENITGQWTQVENVYQRRMDLIPNIVAVAKKYSEFEKSTLEGIVAARAKATQVTISPDNLDEASLEKFQDAQNGVSSALGRLLMVTENYPELKSSEQFMAIMTELEGSENRIARERQVFNELVMAYNGYIRKFPTNIWAGMFGFEKRAAFKMKEGADTAPDVENLLDK